MRHHVADVPLDDRIAPLGVTRQALVLVSHAVALDVRLGHHVESVLVAEVVEVGIVRIMRQPHRVDVVPLHQENVLQHDFTRDGASIVVCRLMPVHALELDRLAVVKENVPLDLDLAEARPPDASVHLD